MRRNPLAGSAASALEDALRRRLAGEVDFSAAARALYATDASNYRQVPVGIVRPRTTDDVIEAVRICREHGVPILPRGAGTSLAGQCCNVALDLDMSGHLRDVLSVDPARRTARVQPGVVLDDLQRIVKPYGLMYGPDPATHAWCTLGGMIGNNACGVHSVVAGLTADVVEDLYVLTADGLRLRVGPTGPQDRRAVRRAWAARRSVFAAESSARPLCGRDPRALSAHSATRLRLRARCPAAGTPIQRRPSARRVRGDVRDDARRDGAVDGGAARASAAGVGISRHLRGGRRGDTDPRVAADRSGSDRRGVGWQPAAEEKAAARSRPAPSRQGVAARGVRCRLGPRGRRGGSPASRETLRVAIVADGNRVHGSPRDRNGLARSGIGAGRDGVRAR